MNNVHLLNVGQQRKLILFLESLLSLFPELKSLLPVSDCVQNIIEITSLLKKDLMRDLYPSFIESRAVRRMRGYLFRSITSPRLVLVDVLANNSTLFHLFMHQSRSHRRYSWVFSTCIKSLISSAFNHRHILTVKSYSFSIARHILLLCYLQLTKIDQQANLLDSLVHSHAVLDLCKEPYLQTLRSRLDTLMDDMSLPAILLPFSFPDDER